MTAHGTAPEQQTFTLAEVMTGEARIRPTVPAESGYDFLRWVIENGISKTFAKDDLSDSDKNTIQRALFAENATDESGVATAVAHWNKLYRLHFDLDGGTYDGGTKDSIDAKEFAFADDVTSATMSDIGVTLPTLAKTDGSTFDKWQLEIRDGSGSVTRTLTYNADALPLSEFALLDGRFSATLKALWKAPDAHDVTYRLTGGSGTGYRGGKDVLTMPAEDVTLYAVWVDDDGKVITPPGTGESSALIAAAFSALTLSLLAIAALMIRKRREEASAG